MAKGGRRLTTSRSERLLGSYNYDHSGAPAAGDESELVEEDVWSVVDGAGVGDDHPFSGARGQWSPPSAVESNGGIRSHPRVPRDHGRHVGGLSLAFEDSGEAPPPPPTRIVHQFRGGDGGGRYQMATSAPVNVPDWSKIYRVNSVESLHYSDEDGDMMPPHEYLAHEYRKMTANSVFEGVGRTLKGRDMSRVRDAVWSQTGFDG
ncbi:hypothetical protein NMG60_11009811 [Bertholletia excelsa]